MGRALGFLADALGLARLLTELAALRRRSAEREPPSPPPQEKNR